MRLADYVDKVGCRGQLVSDGEFDLLEQCTRIRGHHALTYLEDVKYADALANENISCLICIPQVEIECFPHIKGVIITDSPRLFFFKLHNYLSDSDLKVPTKIDPSAKISSKAIIAPYNVEIGKNVEIQPNVFVNENTVICDNVRIGVGTVVGGQSFTAVREGPDRAFLVHDRGSVLIEEGVEICSSCHIACGTLKNDVTRIGAYTKIDAMVHVGHGTVIGKRVLIPAGVMISGNCIIGDDAWIGVNATISNRITIGNHSRVSLGSVVTKDVPAGGIVSGNFAIDHQRFLENLKKSLKDVGKG